MSEVDDSDTPSGITQRVVDERLLELARATEALGPRPGFNARVMLAIESEPAGFWSHLVVSSRWALGIAFVAVVLSLGWAIRAESSANEALAAAYDEAELPW